MPIPSEDRPHVPFDEHSPLLGSNVDASTPLLPLGEDDDDDKPWAVLFPEELKTITSYTLPVFG